MAKRDLTAKELEQLNKNPYVVYAEGNRIVYTNKFKIHFVKENLLGKTPTQIFSEAGFDLSVLGPKRIERAAARWRLSFYSGTLGQYDDSNLREIHTRNKLKKDQEQANQEISQLKNKIARLEHRIASLLKILRLQRECYKNQLALAKHVTPFIK